MRNLDDEAAYIAADDPGAARVVVARILEAVSRLPDQPGLGRPGRIPGTRELVIERTRYVVPYRVRRNTVEILRVFHTSRQLPQQW
jgi:plasmid stabilization system protein ParE